MSIRSTNVFVTPLLSESLTFNLVLRHRYEERSLGIFEVGPEDEDEEPVLREEGSRSKRVGQYFHWHLRRRVSLDTWWLVSGPCFSFRNSLLNPLRSGVGNFLCLHHRTGEDHER